MLMRFPEAATGLVPADEMLDLGGEWRFVRCIESTVNMGSRAADRAGHVRTEASTPDSP
jgi:hypothetical protein